MAKPTPHYALELPQRTRRVIAAALDCMRPTEWLDRIQLLEASRVTKLLAAEIREARGSSLGTCPSQICLAALERCVRLLDDAEASAKDGAVSFALMQRNRAIAALHAAEGMSREWYEDASRKEDLVPATLPTCSACGHGLRTRASYTHWRSPRHGTRPESVERICVNRDCPERGRPVR